MKNCIQNITRRSKSIYSGFVTSTRIGRNEKKIKESGFLAQEFPLDVQLFNS